MNEIEAAFSHYLRTELCISTEDRPNQRARNIVNAKIQERKLTAADQCGRAQGPASV